MKKSLIFFPVFMLLLGGCGTKSETSSSEAPVNPTSSVAPAGPSSVAPTSSQGPSVSPDPSSEVPPSSSADPVVNKYTVTWKDGNDQVIETDTEVVEGTTPSYDGATPTKAADAAATYVFNGNWLPAVGPVTSDVTYVAQFNSAPRQYTITWLDGNGVELKHESVAYGETPEYTGAAPTKNSTAQYSYTWNNGWDPAISAVVGDQTYTATFDQATRKYTVRFIDGDGVELSSEQLDYGATPAYAGSDPTKSQTDEFTYAWDGTWTPAISEVSGDVDYVANFTPTTRQYTIRFIDGDGNAISTQSVNYGELPNTAGLAPTKTEDAAKTYNWNGGWQPAVHNCNGDQDYVATFEENVRQYTIRFFDGDGNKIGEGLWDYGSTPAYEGADPEKSSTVDTVYTWTGEWSPAIKAVDGNQDYVATFNDSAREYTIRFIDGDGNVLDTQSLEYGVTPAYVGADPTKASTAEHTYTWTGGWSPAISAVDGDVDYTATFGESVRKYNVRFYNGEDLVKSEQVDYGSTATAPTEDPTKVDSDYKYTFTGWDADLSQPITGDLDVHAEYSKLKYRQEIETFEHFEVANELADEGWFVTTWKNNQWDKENSASLSLSKNAVEGEQALRLNAYRGNGFKILKEYSQENPNPATERANAFKFSLKTPTGALTGSPYPPRLILYTDIPNPFPANNDPVYLKYEIPITSAEYVDYTIPFAASGWTVFDTAMNLYDVGSQAGIDIDSIPSHITSFEIYLNYGEVSPSEYYGFLDNVAWVTTDATSVVTNEQWKQYQQYTGTTNSGHVFRFDITGENSGVARIIDLETPVAIQGTFNIVENELTFTSDGDGQLSFTGTLKDGTQAIRLTSVSSTLFPELETELANMSAVAVQVIDNFESYSSDGKTYYQSNCAEGYEAQMTGMRGQYYSDYYQSSDGTKTWGNQANWSLMGGNGDQMYLKTDGGHSGSKYMAVKNINGKAAHYMNFDIFHGEADRRFYRGSKLGFWAKAKAGTVVDNFKMYALSKADALPGDLSNGSFAKVLEVTGSIGTAWKHYEVALNPNIVYYGFCLLLNYQGHGEAWLHLDDIQVYAADPWAQYNHVTGVELSKDNLELQLGESDTLVATIAPENASNKNMTFESDDPSVATVDQNGVVEAIGVGQATITVTTEEGSFSDTCTVTVSNDVKLRINDTYSARLGGLVNAFIDIKDTGVAKLRVPGLGQVVDGTYVTSGDDVTFTFGGDTYTATVSADKNTLTFKSVTGTGLVASKFNGVNCEAIFGDDAETYASAGQMYCDKYPDEDARSGARGAYFCEYKGGGNSPIGGSGWKLMGGDGDQLGLDTTNSVDGGQSLKLKYSSGGQMRYFQWDLYKGTAIPKTGYSKFGFYMKNPTDQNVKFLVAVYTAQQLNPSNVSTARVTSGQITINAGTDWTFYSFDLDPTATYYGYSVWFEQNWNSKSNYVNFDKAAFMKNSYDHPFNNFFAVKDLALSGTITAGAATLTFGEGDACQLTCGALGGTVNATYQNGMYNGQQMMVITTASMGSITGTYSVSALGVVTFTVVSATGTLATGVTAGNTLTFNPA